MKNVAVSFVKICLKLELGKSSVEYNDLAKDGATSNFTH